MLDEKFYNMLMEACKLCNYFEDYPGSSDLDIIATYLAAQLDASVIDEEDLRHLFRLTNQIYKTLQANL